MNAVDFPESNTTLGAGDNPNTSPVRIALCKNAQMPNYEAGFLVTRWELNSEERQLLKARIKDLMAQLDHAFTQEEVAERIVGCFPSIYLLSMHSMSPVMVLAYPKEMIFNQDFLIPDQGMADRANSKRIKEN